MYIWTPAIDFTFLVFTAIATFIWKKEAYDENHIWIEASPIAAVSSAAYGNGIALA